MQPPSRNSFQGFTLIEMLVVIAIVSVAGVALSGLIAYFYRANGYVLQETSAVDSAHKGLDTAFEDLREASYGDDGSYPLTTAATSTVTFYSDVDGDGSVEKVRLYLTKGTFYRGVTNAAGNPPSYSGQLESINTIATYVSNATSTPIFRYYDANGTELAAPADVSKVGSIATTLQVDLNPNRAPNIFTLTARATLRNLRAQ